MISLRLTFDVLNCVGGQGLGALLYPEESPSDLRLEPHHHASGNPNLSGGPCQPRESMRWAVRMPTSKEVREENRAVVEHVICNMSKELFVELLDLLG